MPTALETARNHWERYVRARDSGHSDYVKRATRQNSYYCNFQWDQETADDLRAQDRPALTNNLITPTINTMASEFAARRSDVVFKPRIGGDQDVADTLTKVYAQISDSNRLEWVKQFVFQDSLIMDGRGFFDVRIGFEDNWMGEVRVSALDPLDAIPDPDAKTDDPDEWNEWYLHRWLSLDEIAAAYGKRKAEKCRRMGEGGFDWGSSDEIYRREHTYGRSGEMPITAQLEGRSGEKGTIREYLVVERQHRVPGRTDVFLDPATGDERETPTSWTQAKIAEHADSNGLIIVPRMVRRVRWTVCCGSVVLHDDWSPYPFFTIVPCYAFFRRGHPFGPIRLMMSPQDQINKLTSQELHIVNTTANSGWLLEEESLVGKEPSDLEDDGAKTGIILEYRKGAAAPEKIQPNPVPTGIENAAIRAQMLLKEISGVGDALRGTAPASVSGVAIEAQTSRGVLMMQVPFENQRKSEQRLAERILTLVQRFYTEERILMVSNEDDPMKPREELEVNRPTPQGRIVNDLTLGEYDVVISRAPARDSFDEMQFAEALSLRSVGVQIPDDVVVELSHLSRKEHIAKRMREELGIEPSPEQQEALQRQAEVEERMQELAIEELEAKVDKLRAETQKAQAQGGSEAQKTAKELHLEERKLAGMQEQNELRKTLARLSSETQLAVSQNAAASKLASSAMQGAALERAAERQARTASTGKR